MSVTNLKVWACFATVIVCVGSAGHAQSPADWPAPRPVDRQRAASAGIRELTGKHLRLWTDVPEGQAVDELPRVFDAAVPLWAGYFGVPIGQCSGWQVQGFLIQDRSRFAALGLLSERNPNFVNGYALGNELWLDEQPSDYYRRHLLLHEGTHAFILAFLGGMGPGWYAEGVAELLGTHEWDGSQVKLGVLPADKESVPMWGRMKLIRDAVAAAGDALSLPDVLAISNREALAVDAYAWCWALAKFLDSHPRYSGKYRKLASQVNEREFTDRLRKLFHDEWADLQFEWHLYVAALDYGYDTQRMTATHSDVRPLDRLATFQLATDRGWQATPWRLKKGTSYKITAKGRFQIAHDGQPWPCEPGGITLRYHDGNPLGMLLGTLRTEKPQGRLLITPIGLGTTYTPVEDGQLYLRVNDSPAELADNKGTVEVQIQPVTPH